LELGSPEVVSWKSKDGATIEGILYKPADYDPAKKYPLLVSIHGGPTGISRPTLSPATYAYPMQIFPLVARWCSNPTTAEVPATVRLFAR